MSVAVGAPSLGLESPSKSDPRPEISAAGDPPPFLFFAEEKKTVKVERKKGGTLGLEVKKEEKAGHRSRFPFFCFFFPQFRGHMGSPRPPFCRVFR